MGWGLLDEVSRRAPAWRARVPAAIANAVLVAAGEEPGEGREEGGGRRAAGAPRGWDGAGSSRG